MANTNTRIAETSEHWKRWISKKPLRLLSTISARCLVRIAAILEVILEQTLGSGGTRRKLTAMLLEYPPQRRLGSASTSGGRFCVCA
jgi:hypothetical protein